MLADKIIRGSGDGQCLGILNSPALITQAKETGQPAKTILFENITKMYSQVLGRLRNGMVWLYNQEIEPQLFSMFIGVGTAGAPVFMPPGEITSPPMPASSANP